MLPGNLILMQADRNSKIGNLGFQEKSKIYKESSFLLKNQISEIKVKDIKAIENRERVLAELAVKTWQI